MEFDFQVGHANVHACFDQSMQSEPPNPNHVPHMGQWSTKPYFLFLFKLGLSTLGPRRFCHAFPLILILAPLTF